jgi:serine/threonine-protein kinase RsbW
MDEPLQLHLSLDLPRESALIGRTRHGLDDALAVAGVDEGCRDDIRLALTEACANVVKHAELASTYHVEVRIDGDRCLIEVTDDGGGFDPGQVRPHDELDETGRGLRVVGAVVDGLDVVSVDGAGTLLRFSKTLTFATRPD